MITASPGGNAGPLADPSHTKAHTSETESRFLNFRGILAQQYENWRQLPDEDKIRHVYLDSHGLTETSLDRLPQQDRSAHEEKIAELTGRPIMTNTPFRGSGDGDALSRSVVTLQSVLDIQDVQKTDPGRSEGAVKGSGTPASA